MVLPWAVLRFRFDGTEFFYNMFFTEAEDKVIGAPWGYFQWISTILTFRLLVYGILFYLVALGIKAQSVKEFLADAKTDLRKHAILWV